MELFKLLGTIAIDNGGANAAINETTDVAEKSHSKISSAFGKMGSAAVKVGKTVATGLAVGTTAMAGLVAKAISVAGDLEQNMGGSKAVFKESAENMQTIAKTAFAEMGLSASDFLATANKMGALFQGAGFEIAESADMSAQAMQRAADVASIMGVDVNSAMEAVAGMAKGNFTMMDNLGVAINDTTLQIFAQEKGLGKLETTQQKVNAAYMLFMEKSAYAAGNYAKENETLAGALTTAKAAISNFLSGAGTAEQLGTAFVGAGKVIIKKISEILPHLTSGIKELISQLIPQLPSLLQELLPALLDCVVALFNGLVETLPSLVDILVNSLLPQLISGIADVFNKLVSALPSLVETIVSALPTLLPQLINGLVSMIVSLATNFASIIQPIIDNLPDIIISIVNALVDNLPVLIDGCIALVLGLVEAMPQIIQGLLDALPEVISKIISGLIECIPQLIDGIGQLVGGLLSAWGQNWQTLFNAIPALFMAAWESLAPITEWIDTNIIQPIASTFNSLKEKITTTIGNAKEKVLSTIQNMRDGIVDKINLIKTKVAEVFNSIKEKMQSPIESAKNKIKSIVDTIKGLFNGMKLSFPDIKMPHFSIKPKGWKIGDLLEGDIPKLSIDWYAKAMDNPMIMTKPTAFGVNGNGQIMAGGEAGSEVVSGTETLMNMISEAVSAKNARLEEVLLNILAYMTEYMPQMANMQLVTDTGALVGELAPAMDAQLGKMARRSGRGAW